MLTGRGAVTGNVTMVVNDVPQTSGFTLELTDEATGESIGTFTDTDGDGTVAVAVNDEDMATRSLRRSSSLPVRPLTRSNTP